MKKELNYVAKVLAIPVIVIVVLLILNINVKLSNYQRYYDASEELLDSLDNQYCFKDGTNNIMYNYDKAKLSINR